MNRTEIKRKPHEIQPSPCEGCKQDRGCPAPCQEWREWVRQVWPVVTGRGEKR